VEKILELNKSSPGFVRVGTVTLDDPAPLERLPKGVPRTRVLTSSFAKRTSLGDTDTMVAVVNNEVAKLTVTMQAYITGTCQVFSLHVLHLFRRHQTRKVVIVR